MQLSVGRLSRNVVEITTNSKGVFSEELDVINREILEGNWNQFKGQILKKWSQLTDSDLAEFHGNVDELVGVIQRKTGEGARLSRASCKT